MSEEVRREIDEGQRWAKEEWREAEMKWKVAKGRLSLRSEQEDGEHEFRKQSG